MTKTKTQTQLLIETLKKINYVNVEQLVEDINRNFAVIENSPLFKGVPGDEGDPGDPGLRGVRGSQFIFVSLDKFVEQFPKELQAGSNITLEYINSKLMKFETKQLLLKALGVAELVNNDIIVLTNSLMLSYNISLDLMINSGIAFNEQSNIISSIEKKIEGYVKYYVDNNPTILNLQNIFEHFTTIGKNYSDTNNTFVTRRQSGNSALVPYIPGFTNTVGTTITDHKYYGFAEKEFPVDNKGTLVLGSMKKYTQLLMETISSTGAQTISGGYVPTDISIPTAIFLQDTYNAGLMIGYKGKTNLKRFASIFKNDADEICIKSDMGNNPSEYSELLLHKDYLRYGKLVNFLGDIHLVGDFEQLGNIRSPFFRTAKFTNSRETNTMELGVVSPLNKVVTGSVCRNTSDFQTYEAYQSYVFVTDENGKLLKQYAIEKTSIPATDEVGINDITVIPNDPNKVLTSNYLGFVIRKFNAVADYIRKNYWRKDEWGTGVIPNLHLTDRLQVDKNIWHPLFQASLESNTATIGKDNATVVRSKGTQIFEHYPENVFVSDGVGVLSKKYFIEKETLENPTGLQKFTVIPTNPLKFVTSNYLGIILKRFNSLCEWVTDEYWRKDQFDTGVIPDLKLSGNLDVDGNITNPLISTGNDTVYLGKENVGSVYFRSSDVLIKNRLNKVLVTDSFGAILNDYTFEEIYNSESEILGFTNISPIAPVVTKFSTSKHINWLSRKINAIMQFVTDNYWRKNQYETYEIPNMFVNESIKAKKNIIVGDPADADNFMFNADTVNGIVDIGRKIQNSQTNVNSNKVKFDKFKTNVLVCDDAGMILNTYSIEKVSVNTNNIWNIPASTSDPVQNIDLNHIGTYPYSSAKVLTSNYFAMIVQALNNIKTRLKDTFNQRETRLAMYDHMPVGSIIMWTPESSSILFKDSPQLCDQIGDYYFPKGWKICDGSDTISGLSIPDLRDVYARGCTSTSRLYPDSGGTNLVMLDQRHIPNHHHVIDKGVIEIVSSLKDGKMTISGGAHTHRFATGTQTQRPRGGNTGSPLMWWGEQGGETQSAIHEHVLNLNSFQLKNNKCYVGQIVTTGNATFPQLQVPDQSWKKMWYLIKYKNM